MKHIERVPKGRKSIEKRLDVTITRKDLIRITSCLHEMIRYFRKIRFLRRYWGREGR